MTADDLPAAFDTLPAAWAAALPGWTPALLADVCQRVRQASGTRLIGPPDPFRALRLVPPGAARVVVFGQDPYPGAGVADGLAFSACTGKPPSLRRVFDILEADRPGYQRPAVWTLDGWARQGVLLLNPTLTVEIGAIGSHMNCSWHALTSQVVQALWALPTPPVFLLWGKPAGAFFDAIASCPAAVRVLRTRHPSNDFKRQFMAEGSHFLATQDIVDWWAISRRAQMP